MVLKIEENNNNNKLMGEENNTHYTTLYELKISPEQLIYNILYHINGNKDNPEKLETTIKELIKGNIVKHN